MIIEVGDHFVITRGFEYGRGPMFSLALSGLFSDPADDWKPKQEPKPQYDRSHEGMLWRCLANEEGILIGQLVWTERERLWIAVGGRCTFNTREVEAAMVTDNFARACGVDVAAMKEKK